MKQNSFKKPHKTTKIFPEFSSTTLTNCAAFVPFGQFLFEKLGFAKRVSFSIDIPLHHNTVYHTAQILGTLILGYLGGFTRLKHFEEFSKDRVIQTLLQLPRHIDENTFAHRLRKFTFKAANQVQTILVLLQFSWKKSCKKVRIKLNLPFDNNKVINTSNKEVKHGHIKHTSFFPVFQVETGVPEG